MRFLLSGALAAALLVAAAPAHAQSRLPPDPLDAAGRSLIPGPLFNDERVTRNDEPFAQVRTGTNATAGRGTTVVFAAGTVDWQCRQEQVPRITVIDGPTSRLGVDLGPFRVGANDAGPQNCVGSWARGARLFYRGQPPAGGERIVVRVHYPTVRDTQGNSTGLFFDHVVTVRPR